MDPLRVRTYGPPGAAPVCVLHGGPGAPGHVAPICRGLADAYRVFEPEQRRSGGAALTVARHVGDMHDVVERHCPDDSPVLIGSSWGAMLALAYAAAHPDRVRALALIGCGTWDTEARRRVHELLEDSMGPDLVETLRRLPEDHDDPDDRFRAQGELIRHIYSHALITDDLELGRCDYRGNQESWGDMMKQQRAGVYPAAFRSITVPVLMLHGKVDPHPGEMIRDSLLPVLPQLEYIEWEKCGHYPWLEREVHEEFWRVLREWLLAVS